MAEIVPGRTPGRQIRQKRGQKTYDALVATGFKLLERNEFESITIAELAKAAGYSVGAFYARFHSKDEFLDALIAQHFEHRTQARERVFSESTPESLVYEVISELVSYYWRRRGFWRAALLRAMRDHDVKRFVFSSSAAVYGTPDKLPIDETADTHPENPYGATKLMVEQVLEDSRRAWGLSYVALRYFNAGGSTATRGEDHDPETHLIPVVLDMALGRRKKFTIFGNDYDTPDGTCIRDYIHVVDLAEAHVRALDAMDGGFCGPLNLGSEDPFTVLEVVRRTEQITGTTFRYEIGPRRPGDPAALLASSRRAEEVLGWRKRCSSLDEIIRSAYEWRQANPDGYAR